MTKLKQVLKKQGRSVQWLAEQLGFEHANILSMAMTGRFRLTRADEQRAANVLGVNVNDIRD